MANKNYKAGYALELELVNVFRTAGYEAARTAGSHSSKDVIVWKETDAAGMCPPHTIMQGIGFTWDSDKRAYLRTGRVYNDRVYVNEFLTASSECVAMYQCKRKRKAAKK